MNKENNNEEIKFNDFMSSNNETKENPNNLNNSNLDFNNFQPNQQNSNNYSNPNNSTNFNDFNNKNTSFNNSPPNPSSSFDYNNNQQNSSFGGGYPQDSFQNTYNNSSRPNYDDISLGEKPPSVKNWLSTLILPGLVAFTPIIGPILPLALLLYWAFGKKTFRTNYAKATLIISVIFLILAILIMGFLYITVGPDIWREALQSYS